MLEKFFKLSQHKTTVRTELIAGFTTFLAMAYILGVNPGILGAAGMDVHSVFMATAISSGFASILMGMLANYPVALAPGMGVNALFAFTVVGGMGKSWETALAAVFVSGVIFLLISITGIRKYIINAIPKEMKLAIGAGIGFFIAFVGLQGAGLIVNDEATLVILGNVREPLVLLSLFGTLVTIALVVKKYKAAVFIGLLVTAIAGVIMGLAGVAGAPTLPSDMSINLNITTAGSFMDGFQDLFSDPQSMFVIIFSFLFVDFFDTAGTLVAVANRANLVNEKGELENIERALLADSVGTVVGACLGTSTVTSFVESTSGVEVGGRTGLTSVVTGILFFLSILLAPLVISVVTSAVTAPALIVVGILMAQQLKEIDWNDMVIASSAFVTIIFMLLSYSISEGIAFGFITYGIAKVAAGQGKDVSVAVWLLNIVFVLYFALI